MSDDRLDHQPWPLRAAILLVLGALCGLAIHLLLREDQYRWTEAPLRLAGASFVAVGGVALALTLERLRWAWSPAFAVACGLVAGGLVYWNNGPEGWRFASLIFAIGVAAPLFQVVRDEGRWHLAQRPLHAHAWSNLVLWCAAWVFVAIVFLLTFLLGQLFGLIGITFIRNLIEKDWFGWVLVGAALGAGIGLMRDRDRVLGMLQRVVTVVLSMLTPILAIALALFLLSLPFTGLGPLWEETRATTPILLGWAAVSVIFTVATIGNAADEEPTNAILRIGALILALVIFPLAVIAAISTWSRIEQHGFTPDRLWAVTFVLIAGAYGLAYIVSIIPGRRAWPDRIRQTNVWLAVGLCGVALLLATPLIDFGAISTRDQLARLESGTVKPEKFDWRALAFDFGPSGRKALERLKRFGSTVLVRREAAAALSYASRSEMPEPSTQQQRRAEIGAMRILPVKVALPTGLTDQIVANYLCSKNSPCTLYYENGANWALAITPPYCAVKESDAKNLSPDDQAIHRFMTNQGAGPACAGQVRSYYLTRGDEWGTRAPSAAEGVPLAIKQQVDRAWANGQIEVRPTTRRQLFVAGQPVGQPFE